MVAASDAIEQLMVTPVTSEAILAAHARLLADDRAEQPHAGRWRTMQNWIGGSDHSPRSALYVPPPHDLVPGLMDDLLAFTRRSDVPVITQTAIAHAQFESIHPFTDGNGRVGRALAAAVIRERGVARHIVVPIASALVARREHYFDALGAYRTGDAAPIVHAFARSAVVAAEEALVTAKRLGDLPAQWREAAGYPRAGSGAIALLDSLMTTPIFTAEDLEAVSGLKGVRAYRAIDRLVEGGVLEPLTNRKRGQVWGTVDLLAELDDLGGRIARRSGEILSSFEK